MERPSRSPGGAQRSGAQPGSGCPGLRGACAAPPGLRNFARISEPHCGPVQIVLIRPVDPDRGNLPDTQRAARGNVDGAVDLRSVPLAATLGDRRPDLVDDDLLAGTNLALEPFRRNRLLTLHEAMPALLFHVICNERREIVRRRTLDRLIAEATDAIERGFIEPIEQSSEILLGLTGEPDDEGGADRELRADRAPALDALQRLLLGRRPAHALEHSRA